MATRKSGVGTNPVVSKGHELASRRVAKIERQRRELVEPFLAADEQLLGNVIAEVPRVRIQEPGLLDSVTVILYATSSRLIWAGYGGWSYRSVPFPTGERLQGVDYGGFRLLCGMKSERFRGFGFLLLSDEDRRAAMEELKRDLSPIDVFVSWAEQTLGPGAGSALAPALEAYPDSRYLQMFAFPVWSPFVIDLIRSANDLNHFPDVRGQWADVFPLEA